jgi:lanosterol synthase
VDPHAQRLHSHGIFVGQAIPSSHRPSHPLPPTSASHTLIIRAVLIYLLQELYTQPYDTINWPSCRNNVAAVDLYAPHSAIANGLFSILNLYESVAPKFVKNAALKRAYELIVMEDENTAYQVSLCTCRDEQPTDTGYRLSVRSVRR